MPNIASDPKPPPIPWQPLPQVARLRNMDDPEGRTDLVFAMRETMKHIEVLTVGGDVWYLQHPMWLDFES